MDCILSQLLKVMITTGRLKIHEKGDKVTSNNDSTYEQFFIVARSVVVASQLRNDSIESLLIHSTPTTQGATWDVTPPVKHKSSQRIHVIFILYFESVQFEICIGDICIIC